MIIFKKNYKSFIKEIFSTKWIYGTKILYLTIFLSFSLITYYHLFKGFVMSSDSFWYSEAADDLKAIAQERLTWLDKQLDGKDYICGDRFSLADIMFYCFIKWGAEAGQPLNPENINVVKLLDKLDALDSASA